MTSSLLRRTAATVLSAVALSLPLTVTSNVTADAASYHFSNCTALHKVFKHGVGKKNARDHHTKRSKAVTDFKRSTTIYRAAVKFNSDLDRDRDGIACEKR